MDLVSKIKFLIRQFPFIYPKKIIGSCQDWIDNQKKRKGIYFTQRGSWYKTIFPENYVHLGKPQTLGVSQPKAFANNLSYQTDKAALFYLQNCYVFGQKGLVLTRDHSVFQEFSHHFGISSLKKFFRKNPFYIFTKTYKKVDGTGAVLISPESHNYYHWLNDVLPRIKLYEDVLHQVDHFCVSASVPAKFLAVLPDFGIPLNKILLVRDRDKLWFDQLFVSSLPGSEGRSPMWAIEYIRHKLIKTRAPINPTKKIYLKRGTSTSRKILNENIVINILQDQGFEIIEPGELSIYEQINLVQQAKTVISAHGAALSNLLFSNPDLTVIELFSPDYFRTDCYYTLASILKLNYWYIVGEKPAGANWGDMTISEDLLLKTIQQTR